MTKNSVMVTGGAGYIGAHVCKELAHRGFTPVAFDNLVNGDRRFVKWGPLEVGDINDMARVTEVVRSYRPIGVMHFAAFAYVGESVVEPEKYYRNNVIGTLNLLNVMRREGVNKLVFSSSCATYGVPATVPINEDHPRAPVNPYGASKAIVETVLNDFDAAYGLRFASLRYFNAAGADPDGDVGEDHTPETHAIPLAIAAAFGERPCFEIYGTDYATADGTAVRDYIHVSDLASAHVLALKFLLESSNSVVLNLGTGKGHSVREVIAAVERHTQQPVPVKDSPRRPGDPPILIADPSRARTVLGWKALRTDLDSIVGSAVTWYANKVRTTKL